MTTAPATMKPTPPLASLLLLALVGLAVAGLCAGVATPGPCDLPVAGCRP